MVPVYYLITIVNIQYLIIIVNVRYSVQAAVRALEWPADAAAAATDAAPTVGQRDPRVISRGLPATPAPTCPGRAGGVAGSEGGGLGRATGGVRRLIQTTAKNNNHLMYEINLLFLLLYFIVYKIWK